MYYNRTLNIVQDFESAENARLESKDIIESCHNWKTFNEAKEVAKLLGGEFIAIDNGDYVYPRFDICDVPKVGDTVSYSFNGDCRPDGIVTKVSKSLKVITTSTGNKYYRKKQTGRWVRSNTWTLVKGSYNERNKEF